MGRATLGARFLGILRKHAHFEARPGTRSGVLLTGTLALTFMLTGVANTQAALMWVSDRPGTWIDTQANPLNLSDDGEVDINHSVSNAVFGAGVARVGSNGAVRFAGAGLALSFTNQSIPSLSLFDGDQSLAVFWDDIDTDGGVDGNIFWEEANGGNTLVVSWVDAEFFAGGGPVSFQLQVHATGTGDGFAQLLYNDIEGTRPGGGASATIGYQAGGIENDAQWSFDTAGSVSNGTVLTLIPEPASLLLLGLGSLALIRRR